MSHLQPEPAVAAPTFHVRPAQTTDEGGVLDLFRLAFGKSVSPAHWTWKLWGSQGGLQNVWVAEQAGAIIGHYAGTPLRFWMDGRVVQAMVSVDGMVHPEYRGRGVLTKMVTACHQHWAEQGVAFTLGLPNQQWRTRKAALGWRSLFPLVWRIYPTRPERLLARRCHLPQLARLRLLGAAWRWLWSLGQKIDRSITLEQIDHATTALDELWETTCPGVNLSVVRDAAWINWRYLAAPAHDYRLWLARRQGVPVGYLVDRVRSMSGRAHAYIPEIYCDPRDRRLLVTLIARAVEHLVAEGVDTISTLAVRDTVLDRCLRRAGFCFSSGAFDTCITRLQLPVLTQPLLDPNNWMLLGGDFDVI